MEHLVQNILKRLQEKMEIYFDVYISLLLNVTILILFMYINE